MTPRDWCRSKIAKKGCVGFVAPTCPAGRVMCCVASHTIPRGARPVPVRSFISTFGCAAMRDERLQTLLRRIDGAESREVALARLDQALKGDGGLTAVAEEVLRAIGHRTAVESART